MESDITTIRHAEKAVQDLIDSFSEDIFIEACELMIDAATVARDSRKEETEDEN